jgi:hypothetical protein
MEIQLLDPAPGTRFAWGLSCPISKKRIAQDDAFQILLMDYRDGEVSLCCAPDGEDSMIQADSHWHMPAGRWISVSIEYITDMEDLFPSKAANHGMVRLLLRDQEQDFLWVMLEVAPAIPFSGGHMMAGFLQPVSEHTGSSSPELHIKNFFFEN